jgi:hypothetical protein
MVSKPVSELLVDLGVLRSHSHESGSATGCRNPRADVVVGTSAGCLGSARPETRSHG